MTKTNNTDELTELRIMVTDKDKVIRELRVKAADLETAVRNLTEAINTNKMVTELKAKVQSLEDEIEYIKDSSFRRADQVRSS